MISCESNESIVRIFFQMESDDSIFSSLATSIDQDMIVSFFLFIETITSSFLSLSSSLMNKRRVSWNNFTERAIKKRLKKRFSDTWITINTIYPCMQDPLESQWFLAELTRTFAFTDSLTLMIVIEGGKIKPIFSKCERSKEFWNDGIAVWY